MAPAQIWLALQRDYANHLQLNLDSSSYSVVASFTPHKLSVSCNRIDYNRSICLNTSYHYYILKYSTVNPLKTELRFAFCLSVSHCKLIPGKLVILVYMKRSCVERDVNLYLLTHTHWLFLTKQ